MPTILQDIACVFGIIIMLKDQPIWFQNVILHSGLQENSKIYSSTYLFILPSIFCTLLPPQKSSCISKSSPIHHHASWFDGHVEVQCAIDPSPIQHHDLPSKLNLSIIVSSLKITHFQSSMVQFSYLWATLMDARTCLRVINGFLCCSCAPNTMSLKSRLTMMSNNN